MGSERREAKTATGEKNAASRNRVKREKEEGVAGARDKTRIPLYKYLVRPSLEYNSVMWSLFTKNNNDKIAKIQK